MLCAGAVISLFLLSGCVIPSAPLNTINCDPKNRDDCYSVSQDFLEQHFFMEEQNTMMKDNLDVCRKRL